MPHLYESKGKAFNRLIRSQYLKILLALTLPLLSDHYLPPFLDVVDGKVSMWDRACGGSCISLMFGCRGRDSGK